MTFPNYIKGWFFDKKDGWEDLGEAKNRVVWDYKANMNMEYQDKHSFCQRQLRIGREKGQLFKYCPICMIKIKE